MLGHRTFVRLSEPLLKLIRALHRKQKDTRTSMTQTELIEALLWIGVRQVMSDDELYRTLLGDKRYEAALEAALLNSSTKPAVAP
jgi:ethanolamine ammonia-lyase small subunit